MGIKICDTILHNGKIVTVDDDFSMADAVAIRNGKFLKVGRNDEIRELAGPNTREIDLDNRMVVPGFIDTHPHVLHEGELLPTAFSLSGLSSIEEIKKLIAEKVKTTPPGEWIVTMPMGEPPYYHNHSVPTILLKEKRYPTRWDLDEVSPDNPVYISAPMSKSPSTAVLNSNGLKRMNVTKDTPAEQDGVEIVKDADTGEPNGQLHGMQMLSQSSPFYWKLASMLPQPTFEIMIEGVKQIIKERSEAGITAVYECHLTTTKELLLAKRLWENGELPMRIYFAYEVDAKKSLEEIESWMQDLAHATGSGFGDDRLKIGGITVSIDGMAQFGAALMNKPYKTWDGRMTKGEMSIPLEKLKQIALLAARNDLRFNFCVSGDRSADIALEVFEETNKVIPIKDKRWLLQHIMLPTLKNIRKCAKLGAVVTTSSTIEWGRGKKEYVGRFGDWGYVDIVAPFRDWLDAGVVVAQSTDFGPFEPMFTIWQSLKRIDGRTGESLMTPHKKISREEAIRIYTINGAKCLFWEDKLGSIEPGKLADLVVLEKDILTCPVDEIKDTRVLLTMVQGDVVYETDLPPKN
jgi:predicted amidohydrolase YtcJ